MRVRDEVHRALREVVDPSDRVVVVHSSLYELRPPGGALRWEFVAALRALVASGTTVALPAVTFEYCRTRTYDHLASRPETGVLAEWFLELPEVRRTPHPIYSYAVAGPLADELLACRSDAAFGPGTVFEAFERHDARIVMLGAGWESCTQLHRYEELAGVPYRHPMDVAGFADFGAGPVELTVRMVVRDTQLRSELDFGPVPDRLRAEGRLRTVPLFGGRVESVACSDLARVAGELLASDPYALLRDPRGVARRDRMRRRPAARLALAGSRQLDVLAGELAAVAADELGGRPVDVRVTPYGALAAEVLDPGSALHAFAPDATFFVDRVEDVCGVERLADVVDPDRAAEAVDRYAGLVASWAASSGRAVFVQAFGVLQPDSDAELVANLDARLRRAVSAVAGAHVVDLPPGGTVDRRLWLLARVPYSKQFSRVLARRYAGLLLAARSETAKLVFVDLDNTLWGGVLGEDGLGGIAIGGDYPGNAYASFQRVLMRLRERGVALAACSKNDRDHVLAALEHREMVLRADDFVALEVGWRPKWEAIDDLAARLGLGLEHVLFLDDNPVEREHVRQRLPDVLVVDLPDDPAGFADAVLESPYLAWFGPPTDVDAERTQRYRERALVEERRATFARPEDFYASLGTTLHVVPLDEHNLARAAQLSLRTNQFNVTTNRHTAAELEAMAARPDVDVLVVGVEDRFSSREDAGLFVVSWRGPVADVDTYLLSCRVLGRGFEAPLLGWLGAWARSRGATELTGRIVPTERNTPCRGVFAEAGFAPTGDGRWSLDLRGERPAVPGWLRVLGADRAEAASAR